MPESDDRLTQADYDLLQSAVWLEISAANRVLAQDFGYAALHGWAEKRKMACEDLRAKLERMRYADD